jgi:uncharacterized coiled-coil protein SlyX
MNIIFKILKYLKDHIKFIINIIAIILIIILFSIQTISLCDYKTSYKEEVEAGLVLNAELDSVKDQNKKLITKISELEQQINDQSLIIANQEKQISDLNTKVAEQENTITEQAKSISEKDIKIKNLETENKTLKNKASSTTTSSNTTNTGDNKYKQATQVWNSLKALGLNNYVCAGIMGNIMAEVGGQTLDISRWPQYSKGSHYGICQWGGSRKTRLLNDFGTTLEDQIRFLSVELFEEIPKGNSFYSMQDEKEAALYFAKHFERCGTGSYNVRKKNATKALEYFT